MARPTGAEEAILLASDNAAVADYLAKRGEAETNRFRDSISQEGEAALLERNDRLIDLRLAEYCHYPATARALFHRDPTDWALRSLVLSNQKIIFASFPECLFGSVDALRGYLSSVTNDEVSVLFANPAIDDNFLGDLLELDSHWQAMPEQARLVALRVLAYNPKLQKLVTYDDDSGWAEYVAQKPFNAAWRLVITLDANDDTAECLSRLYDRLAPECFHKTGIISALTKWIPQNVAELEDEAKDNKKGKLSSYQSIRRATAAMLLKNYHLKQEKLLESGDSAIRSGAYAAGSFTPEEIKSAIERDDWLAASSLMQNPNCWRTSKHRDALHRGETVSAPGFGYQTFLQWERKFLKEYPDWFKDGEIEIDPEDKPLSKATAGDLIRQIMVLSGSFPISKKLEYLAQAQRVQFWMLAVIIAFLVFRR